jgi:hypothetical protein
MRWPYSYYGWPSHAIVGRRRYALVLKCAKKKNKEKNKEKKKKRAVADW